MLKKKEKKKGTTEDEMAGRHHRLDGHELEWTGRPGVLRFRGRKESDMTQQLN